MSAKTALLLLKRLHNDHYPLRPQRRQSEKTKARRREERREREKSENQTQASKECRCRIIMAKRVGV